METQDRDFKVVTIPSISGYKITKVDGLVKGLSPRTRGIGGVLRGALQSIGGGEITDFTRALRPQGPLSSVSPNKCVHVIRMRF